MWTGPRGSVHKSCFQNKFRTEWGRNVICDLDRIMIVGARKGGLSISETADLLRLSSKTVSIVCREWCYKEKNIQEATILRAKTH